METPTRSTDSLISLVLAVTFIIALVPRCPVAEGWSNGGYSSDPDDPDYGTHDWIADRALDLQTRDVSHFKSTYHDSYLIGTEAPDNPQYIGDYTNHHVYYYSGGSVQDDVSARRAKAMCDSALTMLSAGDFDAAAYYMGAMTHYIADLGVFGHTMGEYTDWGSEVHHQDYESGIEAILNSLTLPSTITLGYSSAYDAAMSLAKTVTFGSGAVRSNVWMDANYDWGSSVFKESAKASLFQSVHAAAAAMNHLLTAAEPDEPEPEDPDQDSPLLHVPDPPASLDAYVEEGYLLLVWSPPTDVGGTPVVEYLVYRGLEPNDIRLLTTVSSYAQTYEDRDAEEGKTYYYRVAAKNAVGIGSMSEVATATLPRDGSSNSLFWPAALSTAAAAVVSAVALVLRRMGKPDRPK